MAGSDFSAVTLFDGGSDSLGLIEPIELSKISISVAENSDTLKFSNSSGSLNGDKVTNWEAVEINDGSTISFSNNSLTADMLSINTGGTLNMLSGAFALTGSLGNLGTFNMSDDNTNDSVTVSGDFSGGGKLTMDVDTTADTSDTLVITGNSSGTTEIIFTNLTPGIATGNTIKDVVTAAGTSSATDFSGSVIGGIFTYNLEYDNKGNFDLIGSINSSSAIYKVAPAILGGFNRMPSLLQRTSHRHFESCNEERLSFSQELCDKHQQPNVWFDTGWTRTEQLTLITGTDLEYSNQDITAGIDFASTSGASGHWVIGGYAQYGLQNASVIDALGTGSAKTTGVGLGANATWYSNVGTYLDLQGKIMQLESELSSSAGGVLSQDASSKASAVSMEIGHRIAITERSRLIPQGQISLGRIDGERFTDTGGTSVNFGSNKSRSGRIGLAYEYVAEQSKFYGIGSIIRDMDSVSKVEAAGLEFSANTNETWAEIGVGGSFTMQSNAKLYGEVSYSQGSYNSDVKAYSANIGIKLNW